LIVPAANFLFLQILLLQQSITIIAAAIILDVVS
jgi:hypothetical protein